MSDLTFVTGNAHKFLIGSHTFAKYGLKLVQAAPHIDEIQSEDAEQIVRRKTDDAYKLLARPVVVSDDSWSIPGLGGFPGPYMKSIGQWLTTDDFLRLTAPLTDRRAMLYQLLVYQDEKGQQLFKREVPAVILTESHGHDEHPWVNLVSLEGDNGKSIAETKLSNIDHAERDAADIWHEFIDWYQTNRL